MGNKLRERMTLLHKYRTQTCFSSVFLFFFEPGCRPITLLLHPRLLIFLQIAQRVTIQAMGNYVLYYADVDAVTTLISSLIRTT